MCCWIRFPGEGRDVWKTSSLTTVVVLGVQILVIQLPEHLEPSSTGASYFAVSISDEASIDAAGSLPSSCAPLLHSELLAR